jgi:hypothetical protein
MRASSVCRLFARQCNRKAVQHTLRETVQAGHLYFQEVQRADTRIEITARTFDVYSVAIEIHAFLVKPFLNFTIRAERHALTPIRPAHVADAHEK